PLEQQGRDGHPGTRRRNKTIVPSLAPDWRWPLFLFLSDAQSRRYSVRNGTGFFFGFSSHHRILVAFLHCPTDAQFMENGEHARAASGFAAIDTGDRRLHRLWRFVCSERRSVSFHGDQAAYFVLRACSGGWSRRTLAPRLLYLRA